MIERSERGSGRRGSQSPPPAGASQEAYHPATTIPPPVSDRLGANEAHCSLRTTLIPRLRLTRTYCFLTRLGLPPGDVHDI